MVRGPKDVPNVDSDTNTEPSFNQSLMNGNGCESGNTSPVADLQYKRRALKIDPKLEALLLLGKPDLPKKPKSKYTRKPDYYDFDGEEVPYSPPDEEAYLTRSGIGDRQVKPPTSKLLIPVMKYDPERPREALWETYKRRDQAVREVVVHPVKDLEYYKLRDCITCKQREKELKAQKEVDQFAPYLQEFLVDDLVDGLTRLIGKVKCFHQEHMCVDSFINMYLNNHFGNGYYASYDLKTTQEELRKFCKLLNCHAETMKCLEMFCTKKQLDGFWRNSGLSSIYEASRNEISVLMKNNSSKLAAQELVQSATDLDTKAAGGTDHAVLAAALARHCKSSDDFNSMVYKTENEDCDNAPNSGGEDQHFVE